jgi:hypothetical protein
LFLFYFRFCILFVFSSSFVLSFKCHSQFKSLAAVNYINT